MRILVFIFERESERERERERKHMCTSESRAEREGNIGSKVGSELSAQSPMWGSNLQTVRS